ncbi:MAG TPA: efflux transporter outer membrane subunit [Verrucomicrobium sp.]|nr:efflux transporter outer membrane subunit [Verrucomicrobium sp.]
MKFMPPTAVQAMVALTLAGALTSCTGTSPSRAETELQIPGKWKGAGKAGYPQRPLNTAALPKWWQRFHDPVLNELVEVALRSSPDIRTAVSKVRESRARRGVQVAGLFPTVDAGASARGDRTDNRSTGVSSSENYGANIDMTWEIDLFGKQRQNIKAATSDLEEAGENLYAAQVSLAAEVADTYVTLRQAEGQLAVVERTLTSRTQTTKMAEWKEQSGEGNSLDTQQAVSTLEQARAQLPSLKQTIGQTRNQLSLLAGQTPGALDRLLTKAKVIPTPPARLAIGIPAETLRQRPDVRAAERRVDAAVARTKSAQAERYPTLSLSGSIGIEALKAGHLFSPETIAGSVAGSLAAPIFDAGRIRQNINIQSELEKQALISWESTVLTALSEVENALIGIQRTAERLVILEQAVKAARQAEQLSSQQYQAGLVDLLVVLEAQRTLLSLEDQQATTLADQASAHIQLYKALGGGWSAS